MRKNSITAELRKILSDLDVKNSYTGHSANDSTVFSDGCYSTYGENAVGIKFVHVYLDSKQKGIVKRRMKKKGFIHHYIRENQTSNSCFPGTRFVFSYQ